MGLNIFSLFTQKRKEHKETPSHYFRLRNGKILKTLQELVDYLPAIPPEEYLEHVTKDKNDFANWIEDVFQDKKLAELMRKAKNQQAMRFILSHYLMDQQTNRFHSSVKNLRSDKKKEISFEKKPREFFCYTGKDLKELIRILEVFDKQKLKTYVTYKENRRYMLDWLNSFLLVPIPSVQADRSTLVQILREQYIKPLREEYEELKADLSRIRKAGGNPIMAELKLLRVPPKILMVGITFEERDLSEAKKLLQDVRDEVKSCIPPQGSSQKVDTGLQKPKAEDKQKIEALGQKASHFSSQDHENKARKQGLLRFRLKQKLKGLKSIRRGKK